MEKLKEDKRYFYNKVYTEFPYSELPVLDKNVTLFLAQGGHFPWKGWDLLLPGR